MFGQVGISLHSFRFFDLYCTDLILGDLRTRINGIISEDIRGSLRKKEGDETTPGLVFSWIVARMTMLPRLDDTLTSSPSITLIWSASFGCNSINACG